MEKEHLWLADTVELAITQAGNKVAAVREGKWENATPCTEWNVKDLVSHMVEELVWIPPILEGQDMAKVQQRIEGGKPYHDLQSVWEEVAPRAVQAIHQTDPERSVEISSGTVPARQFLEEITIDMTVHTWDVAKSIGVDTTLDGRLADAAYELLAQKAGEWRAAGVLGEAVAVETDAGTQTKLLALAGRES